MQIGDGRFEGRVTDHGRDNAIVVSSKSRRRKISRYESKYDGEYHEGHYDRKRRDDQCSLVVIQGRHGSGTELLGHRHSSYRGNRIRHDPRPGLSVLYSLVRSVDLHSKRTAPCRAVRNPSFWQMHGMSSPQSLAAIACNAGACCSIFVSGYFRE